MGKSFKTYYTKFETVLLGLEEEKENLKEIINIEEFEQKINTIKILRDKYEVLKRDIKVIAGDLDDLLNETNEDYFDIKFKLLSHYGRDNDTLNKFGIKPKK